jgi:hypothetical protein
MANGIADAAMVPAAMAAVVVINLRLFDFMGRLNNALN